VPLEDADVGTFLLILGPTDHLLAGRQDPGGLPGTPRPLDRKQALVYGQRAAAAFFPSEHPEVWAAIVPRQPTGTAAAHLHVLVACAPNSPGPHEWAWQPPETIGAAGPEAIPWLLAAADAVASVRNFPDAPSRRTTAPDIPDEPSLTFAEMRARAQHDNEILRDHFRAARVSSKHAETLRQWSYRIPDDGISQAVAATIRRSQLPLQADAADEPFNFNSEVLDPPHTQPAPPVPAQQSDFRPSSIKDILLPWAVSAIDEWFAREEADLRAYAADPTTRRRTNKPLVIDQDGFFPRAQGLFWDLHGAVPQLMRRDAPGITRLNADAIRSAAGPSYQDQELLHGIQHCVRMPAEHQTCIVLLPNLISIAAGMPQHHADIAHMETDRILSAHASMPFIPGVLLPQGSTGKIHEPDRRRRITDAGAPRTPLTSRMDTAIVPMAGTPWSAAQRLPRDTFADCGVRSGAWSPQCGTSATTHAAAPPTTSWRASASTSPTTSRRPPSSPCRHSRAPSPRRWCQSSPRRRGRSAVATPATTPLPLPAAPHRPSLRATPGGRRGRRRPIPSLRAASAPGSPAPT
jgi:hypothetical protein